MWVYYVEENAIRKPFPRLKVACEVEPDAGKKVLLGGRNSRFRVKAALLEPLSVSMKGVVGVVEHLWWEAEPTMS